MPWDPSQYEKFKRERELPFEDVLALIEKRPRMRVIDLGCGTGALTQRLADALVDAEVLGVDSSTEMLQSAAPLARANLRFAEARIEDVTGEFDLVLSNAALHWVPDHARLIPRLVALLSANGQLVVQMPNNWEHASHVAIREEAARFPELHDFDRAWPVLPIDAYAEILFSAGARAINVFEKVYTHVLPDADALVEWQRGTALVPYLERLGEDARRSLTEGVRARLRARFPTAPVLFAFRRVLFSARRA